MSDDIPLSEREVGEAGEETPEEEISLPPLPVRYARVFFSPGPLFERLAARPTWFFALLLAAALISLGTYLIPAELQIQAMREQMMSSGGPTPPSEFGENMGIFRTVSLIAGPVFYMIFTIIIGGIVMGIFNFLFGEEGTFKQYLAVLAHANLVVATSYLLLVPLRIQAQDPQLLLSVGTFLPFLSEGWLAGFFGFLDLFSLWSWTLVALGVSKMTRVGWGAATAAVMVIPVAFAAIFAFFP